MNLIELVLFIIGVLLFPYGLWEIIKGNGSKIIKIILILISIVLFIIESILVLVLI
jgi:hypothetical protein